MERVQRVGDGTIRCQSCGKPMVVLRTVFACEPCQVFVYRRQPDKA